MYGAVRFVGGSRGCVASVSDFKEGTDVASLLAGDPRLCHRLTGPLIAFLEELLASGYGVRLTERDDRFIERAHLARLIERYATAYMARHARLGAVAEAGRYVVNGVACREPRAALADWAVDGTLARLVPRDPVYDLAKLLFTGWWYDDAMRGGFSLSVHGHTLDARLHREGTGSQLLTRELAAWLDGNEALDDLFGPGPGWRVAGT